MERESGYYRGHKRDQKRGNELWGEGVEMAEEGENVYRQDTRCPLRTSQAMPPVLRRRLGKQMHGRWTTKAKQRHACGGRPVTTGPMLPQTGQRITGLF